jgi:SAM-dependent methyltransferase
LDDFWRSTTDFLRRLSLDGEAIVVHPQMMHLFPKAKPYASSSDLDAKAIDAIALHKGIYTEVDCIFLQAFMHEAKPVFANEVFVVLARAGDALPVNDPHLAPLREIDAWIRHNAAPEWLESEVLLERCATFIERHLAKPVDLGQGKPVRAIAETPERFNDTSWFWADDAGKVAELLALPALRNSHRDTAETALDFVLRLSPDRIIHRRAAKPELELVSGTATNFHARNAFFQLTGNTSKGVVNPAIRFNDDRTRYIVDYAPGILSFRYRGLPRKIHLKSAIISNEIVHQDDHIQVRLHYRVHIRSLGGSRREIASLLETYTLWRDRAGTDHDMTIKVNSDADGPLQKVRLTSSMRGFKKGGRFSAAVTGYMGNYARHAISGRLKRTIHSGAADFVLISEGSVLPGFATAIHSRLDNAKEVATIMVRSRGRGCADEVSIDYALGTLSPGASHTVSEYRLLTGGGWYDDHGVYNTFIDPARGLDGSIDPSMSYDIGAELNAVAVALMFNARGQYDPALPKARVRMLKAWYDRHLEEYVTQTGLGTANASKRVFARGLAFVILSLDAITRTFPEKRYARALRDCTDLLLTLESPVAGGQGEPIFSSGRIPELDCHAAALLALARAAFHRDDGAALAAAVTRGLAAIYPTTVSGRHLGHPNECFETLAIRSSLEPELEDTGFWTFKLGLLLRAFNALHQAAEAGRLPLSKNTLDVLHDLNRHATWAMVPAIRLAPDTAEILTSVKSGETNSETQPWTALGLAPAIEWELYGKPENTKIPYRALLPKINNAADTDAGDRVARGNFDRASDAHRVDWQVSQAELTAMTQRVAETWSVLGSTCPHWSVLSGDEYLPDAAVDNLDHFYASGTVDRDWLVATIGRAGRRADEFRTVLEYGCGLGRVTNHLAESFTQVIGCDISQTHLELAREYTAKAGITNVEYRLSRPPEYAMAAPYDLWFSFLVLQHNPPPVMASVLRQGLRKLNSGGLAVFQIPVWARTYQFNATDYLMLQPPKDSFELHCLPQHAVFKLLQETKCTVLEVFEDDSIGDPDWISNVFVASKT